MPAIPRIVFSTFRSEADPMYLAWSRFLQSIQASSKRASRVAEVRLESPSVRRPLAMSSRAAQGRIVSPGTFGIWRILASNNRELGRSALAYTTLDSARAHVQALRGSTDALSITVVNGNSTGKHGWYMTMKGSPVLTCGRWYGASASSSEAALATIEALRDGEIEAFARSITPPRRNAPIVDDCVW
ncbi:hypothetical protein [Leifsonia poae]|uniref:hypothetical protein n=1 Tax=Leifsonia poae TaxID=110933 RepID=UPI001CBEAA7E|nr:hypothetical protein [Leifsonia poae]